MKRFLFPFLISVVGIIVWYPILKVFYLQDEWQGLGHIFIEGVSHPFAGANFFQLIFGEDRSLARLLGLFLFGRFPLNALPVAIFSLTFHLLNSCLVFFLANKIFKKGILSFIAAAAFMISSVSANAVYWFSTSVGTLPATTLIIIAIFNYFEYLKDGFVKRLYLVFGLLFVSLFFKEIATFLFIFLPIFSLLFKRGKVGVFVKKYWIFIIFFILLVGFRILQLKSMQGPNALFITGSSSNFSTTLLTRAILYPLTSFSLEFFPAPVLVNFARGVTSNYYPFIDVGQFDLISQTAVLDLVAAILSLIMFFVFNFFVNRERSALRVRIVFWFLFIIFSFLPYIIISKTFSYLESRYYYLSLVGASIIFSWFVSKMFESKRILFKILGISIISLYFFGQIKYLRADLGSVVKVSAERVNFIKQIDLYIKPTQNPKNIFYISSDSDYYIVGNKIPFQQGTGYTLMILSWGKLPLPGKFLTDPFLWDIGSQGYKEDNGVGFGYFSDEGELRMAIKNHNLSRSSLKAFFYDSKKEVLVDVTNQVSNEVFKK